MTPKTFPELLEGAWKPFSTAPRDGTVFRIRNGKFAHTHAFYRNGDLHHIEYQHTNRPTEWAVLNTPTAANAATPAKENTK